MSADVREVLIRSKVQGIILLLLDRGTCSQMEILRDVKGNTEGKLKALDYAVSRNLVSVIDKSKQFPYNKKTYVLTKFGIEIAEYVKRSYRFLSGYLPKERQAWLITLFRMMGKPLCRTEVQKLMFLLREEYSLSLSNDYFFEPYLFGPYSSAIEEDLFELEELGLLNAIHKERRIDSGQIADWKEYYLSELGRASARRQKSSKQVIAAYAKLREKFSGMRLSELIQYVYLQHPEYARNSVLNKNDGQENQHEKII
jgi:uncharacterized protein YwgA